MTRPGDCRFVTWTQAIASTPAIGPVGGQDPTSGAEAITWRDVTSQQAQARIGVTVAF
jgi:hypothetical protein